MKITRANVADYATKKGLEPIQIDGVIDGFAWKESDIEIGGAYHKGKTLIFNPLADWQDKDAITYAE